MRRLHRAGRNPIPYHFCVLNTEFVPDFPDVFRISPLIIARRHPIDHPPPRIPVALQHFTEKPKRNSRNLDKPIIWGFVVIVPFPKPQAVDVREVLHVFVGRADAKIVKREFVARMEVDE